MWTYSAISGNVLSDLFDSVSVERSTTFKCESNDERYIIYVPLPGVKKDDVVITTSRQDVWIDVKVGSKVVVASKCGVRVPTQYDLTTLKARLSDGLLALSIERSQESRGRSVPIE